MSQQTLTAFRTCLPIFSVLADENRQNILCLLDDGKLMNVNQITENLHLSRPTVSHHLKLLLEKNLLTVNQIGKERYYQLNLQPAYQTLKQLVTALEQDETIRQSQINKE